MPARVLNSRVTLIVCWLAFVGMVLLWSPDPEAYPRPNGLGAILMGAVRLPKEIALVLLVACVVTGLAAARGTAPPAGSVSPAQRPFRFALPILALILLLGAGLRFGSLDFGLPEMFHADEGIKVGEVLSMEYTGTFEPTSYRHPSLLLYATYVSKQLLIRFGFEERAIPQTVVAGRIVSALVGTLSILMVFLLARALSLGDFSGLVAAALLSVAPLHVTCSRYLKEDALVVFTSLVAITLFVKSIQSDHQGWLLLTGFFTGIAISSKYSALVLLLPFMAWPWVKDWTLAGRPRDLKRMMWAAALVPVGFLVCSPYALQLHNFATGFGFEARHMIRGHSSQMGVLKIDAWSQLWMYQLGRSLVPGLTLVAALVGLIGLAMLLARGRRRDLLVVGFALLFYLEAEWVRAKPPPQPERYVLPVVPFLCLAAAQVVDRLRASRWKPAAWALLLALLLVPTARSVWLNLDLTRDTRSRLSEWGRKTLPPGSKIFVDSRIAYSGRLPKRDYTIEYGDISQWQDLRRRGYDYLVESSFGSGRYLQQPNSPEEAQRVLREMHDSLTLIKEFRAASGAYGFHNPWLRVYRLE